MLFELRNGKDGKASTIASLCKRFTVRTQVMSALLKSPEYLDYAHRREPPVKSDDADAEKIMEQLSSLRDSCRGRGAQLVMDGHYWGARRALDGGNVGEVRKILVEAKVVADAIDSDGGEMERLMLLSDSERLAEFRAHLADYESEQEKLLSGDYPGGTYAS